MPFNGQIRRRRSKSNNRQLFIYYNAKNCLGLFGPPGTLLSQNQGLLSKNICSCTQPGSQSVLSVPFINSGPDRESISDCSYIERQSAADVVWELISPVLGDYFCVRPSSLHLIFCLHSGRLWVRLSAVALTAHQMDRGQIAEPVLVEVDLNLKRGKKKEERRRKKKFRLFSSHTFLLLLLGSLIVQDRSKRERAGEKLVER